MLLWLTGESPETAAGGAVWLAGWQTTLWLCGMWPSAAGGLPSCMTTTLFCKLRHCDAGSPSLPGSYDEDVLFTFSELLWGLWTNKLKVRTFVALTPIKKGLRIMIRWHDFIFILWQTNVVLKKHSDVLGHAEAKFKNSRVHGHLAVVQIYECEFMHSPEPAVGQEIARMLRLYITSLK